MHKYRAAIAALTFLLLSVFANFSAADDTKVTLIEVQGNKRIESSTILARIKTKEGNVFSPAVIREDIKVLYQLGHFEDVQVRTEGFENGLKVIFSVKEKPLIREITFEGHDELTTEKLKEILTLLPRTAFNMQLINDNAEKIRLKYQDDGYYDAVVVPVVTELRNGDRNVVFHIEEGKKVRLQEVIIVGSKAISEKEIKAALKNQERWLFSFIDRSGTLRTEELKEDLEIIRNLYYNKGYIQVVVDDPVIEPEIYTFRECYFWGPLKTFTRKSELVIRINIKEGEQFRVGSVTLKGNELIPDAELSKEIKLANGDVFSREVLRQDVGRIMDRYDSIARPFANVIPQFNIDQDKKTVAIQIDIQEGGEVRIGRIDITGNSKTRDKVIRREMRLEEGDLYSKKAIKRSYERINNLNFFETVELVPERRQQEPIMDFNVKVKEKLTGTFSIGGGYSSVDKLMAIVEVSQGNLGGRGQLLKFKTQWGKVSQLLMLSFMEPYLFDIPLWGKVDVYKQSQDYSGYWLKTNGFALSAGKSFGEYVSTSLRFSYDNSLVTDIQTVPAFSLQRQLDVYGDRISTNALTWSISRDSRDYYLDPKTGSRNSVYVEYAGGPLGGDPNFVKTSGDSAWYFPLFWDTVFMVRGRVGYVESLINKPVPLGERFFVGGPSTLRGFRFGTAGPMDDALNLWGGNRELIYNIEYTFPIVPAARVKGVLFYDIGKAFDNYETVKFSELRQTYGWGFWWLSPIGPLRFEWGKIIKERPDDQASKFEFSIGTLF
ncbi:MAG: outer membrane protein assembly factor BamA [Nitrospirae bacterium]|nr:outer membrane protein assembly factor BamA [Nitrospirota bacterium]